MFKNIKKIGAEKKSIYAKYINFTALILIPVDSHDKGETVYTHVVSVALFCHDRINKTAHIKIVKKKNVMKNKLLKKH